MSSIYLVCRYRGAIKAWTSEVAEYTQARLSNAVQAYCMGPVRLCWVRLALWQVSHQSEVEMTVRGGASDPPTTMIRASLCMAMGLLRSGLLLQRMGWILYSKFGTVMTSKTCRLRGTGGRRRKIKQDDRPLLLQRIKPASMSVITPKTPHSPGQRPEHIPPFPFRL